MTYSTYDCDSRDRRVKTFPVATVDRGLVFGLAPADLVFHSMDRDSFGFVVAVCCDTVTVLWSVTPKRPYA